MHTKVHIPQPRTHSHTHPHPATHLWPPTSPPDKTDTKIHMYPHRVDLGARPLSPVVCLARCHAAVVMCFIFGKWKFYYVKHAPIHRHTRGMSGWIQMSLGTDGSLVVTRRYFSMSSFCFCQPASQSDLVGFMLILIYLNIVLFSWTDLAGVLVFILLFRSVCIPTHRLLVKLFLSLRVKLI